MGGWFVGSDIVMNFYVGPMFFENELSLGVLFYELRSFKPTSPFETKRKPADSTEEIEDSEPHTQIIPLPRNERNSSVAVNYC